MYCPIAGFACVNSRRRSSGAVERRGGGPQAEAAEEAGDEADRDADRRGDGYRAGGGHDGVDPADEFGELGSFFNTVSQQLSADRSLLAGQKANLQSAVEHLEDAVALFNASGELLYSNPAMEQALPPNAIGRALQALLPTGQVALPADLSWWPYALGLALCLLFSNLSLQYGAARLAANTTSLVMLSEILFATASSVALGVSGLSERKIVGGLLIVFAAVLATMPSSPKEPP